MRKLMLVMALVVMAVPLLAGAAFAANQIIQCRSMPCYGTRSSATILERMGNGKPDMIIARGAHDLIRANKYTNDTDVVKSGGLRHGQRSGRGSLRQGQAGFGPQQVHR
jgi:hypothetical protein